MAKKKKKHSFAGFMLAYALLFIMLMFGLVRSLYSFLEEYEAARPEHFMDSYVLSLSGERIKEAAEHVNYDYDEELVSRETMTELFIAGFPSDVSYKKDAALSTLGRTGYNLISNGQKIGTAVICQLPETEPDNRAVFDELWQRVKKLLGCSFGSWVLESEEFLFHTPEQERMEVTVPETWSVYCGEKLLGEKYVTASEKIAKISSLYEEYKLPMLKTYSVDAFTNGSALKTLNKNGELIALSGNKETDEELFISELFPPEADALKKAAEEFLELYIAYCSGAKGERHENLKSLRTVLLKDSDIDKRMVQALDGQYYTHSKSDIIKELRFNLILPGDGFWMTDLSYVLLTTGNAGEVRTENNMQVFFSQQDGRYLAERIMVY